LSLLRCFIITQFVACGENIPQADDLPEDIAQMIRSSSRFEQLYAVTKTIHLVAPDSIPLGDIQSISVTRHGSIAVLDRANPCPTVFDSSGRFLYRLGRSGAGPGEFRNATAVAFDEGHREWSVADGPLRRVHVFGDSGNHIGTTSVSGRVHGLITLPDREYLLFLPGRWGIEPLVERVDRSGNVISQFFTPTKLERNIPFALSGGGICATRFSIAAAHYLSSEISFFDVSGSVLRTVDITNATGYLPPDMSKVMQRRVFMASMTGILAILNGPYGLTLAEYGNSPSRTDLDAGKHKRLLYLAFVRDNGELLGSVSLPEPITASDPYGNLYFVGFLSDTDSHPSHPIVRKWSLQAPGE
jgi:hypothetical protein